MKALLIGTPVESFLFGCRERAIAARSALFDAENVGDIANNAIAGQLVGRLCKPGMTFIDVGAHIGSVVSAARRDKSVKVIAVEAIPAKAANLRRKFPDIQVHECAVGDSEGLVSFFIDPRRDGYSSLARTGGATEEIKVTIKRLDDLVSADDVDVIKIDVEGAELGVLRGAEQIIARCRPVVMFESGPEEVLGFTKSEMWEWLSQRDYGLFAPNRVCHTGAPMNLSIFLDSHEYPRRCTNYFAVPNERVLEIRDRARKLAGIEVN